MMKDLGKKYPFIYSVITDDDDALTPEAWRTRQQECFRKEESLRSSARDYVKNIDVFSGSRFHDAKVISAKLENDCLAIRVDDLIAVACFHHVNALLGLGLPEKKIKCPVTIRLEGLRKLKAYMPSCDGLNCLTEISATEALPTIREFLYDEISKISRRSISLGFIFETKKRQSVVLEVDARRISFEENLRSIFTSLFGEENIDIFDALWAARLNRKLGWDTDPAIRIIRSLRPELPKDYDVKDYTIWAALEMEAGDAASAGKLAEAVELYKKLLPSHWNQWIIWGKLGECLFKLERYHEAKLYFFALLGYRQNDLNARFLLAQTYHRLKNPDDAADELAKCLKIDPKFEPARQYIAQHKDIQKCIEDDIEDDNE